MDGITLAPNRSNSFPINNNNNGSQQNVDLIDNNNNTITSSVFPAKFLPLVFCLCLWSAVCGGTLYMFASMEDDLLELCNWKAGDINAIYAAGQIGVLFESSFV